MFDVKNYQVWVIPGNVDSLIYFESTKTKNVKRRWACSKYKNKKIGFAGGGVPTPINARGEISEEDFQKN